MDALLRVDALAHAQRIYAEAGGIGLFVDARDEHVAGFCRSFGFAALPDKPLLFPVPDGGGDRQVRGVAMMLQRHRPRCRRNALRKCQLTQTFGCCQFVFPDAL